jgi:hypothetical protein
MYGGFVSLSVTGFQEDIFSKKYNFHDTEIV